MGNLLSRNQATIDTDASGWKPAFGFLGKLAPSPLQALDGSQSLALTDTTGQGFVAAESWPPTPIVAPGTYSGLASYRAATVVRPTTLYFIFHDATCKPIAITETNGQLAPLTFWSAAGLTGIQAPATATTMSLVVAASGTGVGETVFADCMGIFPGSVTEWTPPDAATAAGGVNPWLVLAGAGGAGALVVAMSRHSRGAALGRRRR